MSLMRRGTNDLYIPAKNFNSAREITFNESVNATIGKCELENLVVYIETRNDMRFWTRCGMIRSISFIPRRKRVRHGDTDSSRSNCCKSNSFLLHANFLV